MSTQVAATAATTDPAVARRAGARRATGQPAGGGKGRQRLEIVMFVTPALALMAVFVVYPIYSAARMSLYNWKGFGPMVDFVGLENFRRVLTDEVQQGFAENDMGLPTNPAAGSSVKDPALAELLKVRDEAPYVQLYFDTAFGTSVGGAMNDEIALLFAGQASPQDVVDATQQAADQE